MSDALETADLVIFGGTGDLSLRKLLPALYRLQRTGLLTQINHIIATGRQDMARASYLDKVRENLEKHILPENWDLDIWHHLSDKLLYHCVEAATDSNYQTLAATLQNSSAQGRIFYLATLPSLYGEICHRLRDNGALQPNSRVVLEKPIGHNLASCHEINRQVFEVFDEQYTFRIDHYLGKETVQNLLALRFSNTLFHPMWNNIYIDHVQITVAEDLGVGGRGSFYAKTGALRDMVQNHLLQVLCMVAMEPPANMRANTIRDEKVKVLKSLQAFDASTVAKNTVRGRYSAGAIDGLPVNGFLQEPGFEDCRDTETFTALRCSINNWRWAGVPFYLRTGKRLSRRFSEIVIEFRKQAFTLFADDPNDVANKLVITLQPEEDITLHILNKKPGLTRQLRLQPVVLDLGSHPSKKEQQYEAYERLLLDIIAGDQTLFMRFDEVESAWSWADSIIQAWDEVGMKVKDYPAGSMGPNAALALPEREGRSWHE